MRDVTALPDPLHIQIDLDHQTLQLFDASNHLVKQYLVSTAANGIGEQRGSYQTPRGEHYIRAKIGYDAPRGAVFVARRPTGEVCTQELWCANPTRDWILTRILWLCGTEKGKNRGGNVDTFRRYIYIHGTPDHIQLGRTGSRGCIRMNNDDLIELFNLIKVGCKVNLHSSKT